MLLSIFYCNHKRIFNVEIKGEFYFSFAIQYFYPDMKSKLVQKKKFEKSLVS